MSEHLFNSQCKYTYFVPKLLLGLMNKEILARQYKCYQAEQLLLVARSYEFLLKQPNSQTNPQYF